jgi:hypothetical protein
LSDLGAARSDRNPNAAFKVNPAKVVSARACATP